MSISKICGVAAPTTGGTAVDQYTGALLAELVNTANSTRSSVTCTATASAHTWGAWQEVDASLSADANGVVIALGASTFAVGANTSTLLQIGTGAGGAEAAWATVNIGYRSITQVDSPIFVPGFIAAGTRVAVRCQSVVATGKTVQAFYQFIPATKSVDFGAPVTYQADTASSRGLVLTAPGSLNTKGNWTELVASTAQDLSALCITASGAGGTNMSGSGVLLDIGTGAGGAETVKIPDIYLAGNASEIYICYSPTTYGVNIPSGTRIAARYQRANANNGVDLIVVGA